MASIIRIFIICITLPFLAMVGRDYWHGSDIANRIKEGRLLPCNVVTRNSERWVIMDVDHKLGLRLVHTQRPRMLLLTFESPLSFANMDLTNEHPGDQWVLQLCRQRHGQYAA